MIRASVISSAAMLSALSGSALSQVPPNIAAKVRATGQILDPSAGRLYAPMFASEPWPGVTVSRDVAYGSDPLQKLDIYAPSPTSRKLPVLLFVHGGGFVAGDKHGTFAPDNITLWAARNGMIGVNIDYRLAPRNIWPSGAMDLAAAIAWVHANIAPYGGDPARIILWGHSAGANHVADYITHPDVQGSEWRFVRGAILLSPFYAEAPSGDQPHVYYGRDDELQTSYGSIARLQRSDIPLFLANAEFDPVEFKSYMTALRLQLCKPVARCPRYVYLKDHNHFTESMAVGTPDQSLTGPLLQWIRSKR
ncbi:alpha/beta hydrolase [Rhizorhabdus dicambivorans]|uniref:Alpha/beta hydrolase n=1 Tax=Rhizorhabdus dicambivorans TaxID=1850238 RepID=A0A2A4FQS0_9SPHN|nr:alpha/beta hydrolase [Rhizorhabdus dicambivorans]ATE65706.1 alpha/beta hydrolase [Rhizorhabdus dicambivorans]PCE40070.1 alpha/beta hydrolase [Rhizorhabdus dicambivorans]